MEKNNNMRSKKAQIGDIAFVMVTLLSIFITLLAAAYIYNQIDNALSDSGLETNTSAEAYDAFDVAFGIFDKSFIFITIVLIIALLVSSFAIPAHPIFLVINIVGFLVLVFLGMVLSNIGYDISQQDGLNTTITTYPFASYVISKLPWIGAIIVLLSSIIMYSKVRSEGGYG
jgi:hypothetical protein